MRCGQLLLGPSHPHTKASTQLGPTLMLGVALTMKPLVQLAYGGCPVTATYSAGSFSLSLVSLVPWWAVERQPIYRPRKEVQTGSGPRAHGRAGIQTQVSGALLLTSMKALDFHPGFCLVALREQTSSSGSVSLE